MSKLEESSMPSEPTAVGIFDFDNHYYEAEDAFTRHADRSLRNRGVRWADIDGRRRLLVGGTLNSYIANPVFDPVAKPGALFDWYRGNPQRQGIVEAFGELEPIRPEYRDRDVRLKVMGDQGRRRDAAVPDARRRHRGRAGARPGGVRQGRSRRSTAGSRTTGGTGTRGGSSPCRTSRSSSRSPRPPSCAG